MATKIVSDDSKSEHYRRIPLWKRAGYVLGGAAVCLLSISVFQEAGAWGFVPLGIGAGVMYEGFTEAYEKLG